MADFDNLKPGTYNPKPGSPLDPSKYPRVGPNGQHYGTQPGYIYNYLTDKYDLDPKAVKDYQNANGLAPKTPSLSDTLLPVAAVGGTIAAAQGLGKDPAGFLGGIKNGAQSAGNAIFGAGTFGGGASAPAASSAAGSTAAAGAAPGVPTGLTGSVLPDTAASTAPGAFSLSGIGSAGNAFLPAAGLFGAYDTLSNPQRGPLEGGLEGAASGAALGSYFGPPGALIGAGVGGVAGLANGLFYHKPTKQYEKERWGDVQKQGITDASAAQAANHPVGDTGVWQSGPFAGKKWNFQDAATLAKQDPSQFQLVLGNYQTFGNDWSNYTPDQRNAIVKGVLDAGLYKGDHGDVVITDQNAAKAIKDQVLAGTAASSAVTPDLAQKTQGVTTPPMPGQMPAPANFTPVQNNQPQGNFGAQTPLPGSPAPMPSPNRNLDNPLSIGMANGTFGAGAPNAAPTPQPAQPNQWGNTRISPGVYKDASGKIIYSTTGQ